MTKNNNNTYLCYVLDIQEYFIHRLASDDRKNCNYRSLIEGQNYLSSGWVGQILHRFSDDHIILKASVRHSQAIHCHHNVEVTVRREGGQVMRVSCDCMAGRGCCCSHTAALLYKVKEAVRQGLTGMSCTDQLCAWNKSRKKNQ